MHFSRDVMSQVHRNLKSISALAADRMASLEMFTASQVAEVNGYFQKWCTQEMNPERNFNFVMVLFFVSSLGYQVSIHSLFTSYQDICRGHFKGTTRAPSISSNEV